MSAFRKDRSNKIIDRARDRYAGGHKILVFDFQLSTISAASGFRNNIADVLELIEEQGWDLDHATMANTRWIGVFRRKN
jgi:hypothetical protein